MFRLEGFVEIEGKRLPPDEVREIAEQQPDLIASFGGEFFLISGDLKARDHYGIIPGDCPAGKITVHNQVIGCVSPGAPETGLDQAVQEAVRIRSDEGVTALSGGVDSALVGVLAGLPCVVVGIAGSHDISRAFYVARETGLRLECVTLENRDIEEGLTAVVPVIPSVDPVNTSIAVTMHCITKWAGESGYHRVLAGQGADEIFGGYARYLTSDDLESDLEADFRGLGKQAERDQAVANLNGTYISMPYLDVRVVRAASRIPASEKVSGGVRKRPLRVVAERHIPAEIAWYDKKAMQYGSGVWRAIRELARHNGYKRSVQGYINEFGGHDHDLRE